MITIGQQLTKVNNNLYLANFDIAALSGGHGLSISKEEREKPFVIDHDGKMYFNNRINGFLLPLRMMDFLMRQGKHSLKKKNLFIHFLKNYFPEYQRGNDHTFWDMFIEEKGYQRLKNVFNKMVQLEINRRKVEKSSKQLNRTIRRLK